MKKQIAKLIAKGIALRETSAAPPVRRKLTGEEFRNRTIPKRPRTAPDSEEDFAPENLTDAPQPRQLSRIGKHYTRAELAAKVGITKEEFVKRTRAKRVSLVPPKARQRFFDKRAEAFHKGEN